jgi:hypothetical protein
MADNETDLTPSAPPNSFTRNDLDDDRQEPIGGDADFDHRLEAWFCEKNYENLPAVITLYKFKSPNNPDSIYQCNQWKNEIPETHTIGLKFGAGKYKIIINIPPGKKQRKITTSRVFELGPYYDELMKQEQSRAFLDGPGGPRTQAAPLPAVTVAGPLDTGLALMERMLAMLAPIIAAATRPPSNPGTEMIQAYASLNHILKEQALDTQNILTDRTRQMANLPIEYGGDEPPAQPKPDVLTAIIPFIAQIAEKILGGGPQGTIAAGMVKSVPGFKNVVNNPNDLKTIVAYLDKKFSPEKTNVLLKKLKVERPK